MMVQLGTRIRGLEHLMGWSVLLQEIRFVFTRSGDMTRAREIAQRKLARLLRGRKEPHGKSLTDESILRGVDVDDSGIVQLWIQPTHPHCPCCIDDLISLRSLISGQSGILACHIEVVGIPHSDRWTAAVNE